jgi:mRNA interferase RelE/StbE
VQYEIEFTPLAMRQFRKLSANVQQALSLRIDALASDPRPKGCKKLAETDDSYRIRSGNYRIVYRIEDSLLVVLVIRIGNRKEVYRQR